MPATPLIINQWSTGTASSPHVGFGLMRNVEIDDNTGAVMVAEAPTTQMHVSTTGVFTADSSTDICTFTVAETPITGTPVTLTTTDTLPAGLSTGTVYFIIKLTTSTFQLATTIANADAGTQINITDNGTGTHTATTVDMGEMKHSARDTRTNNFFVVDDNGRVWYGTANSTFRLLHGNTLTNASGNGLAIIRASDNSSTWLIVFRNNTTDVVDVFGQTEREDPSWTNGWQSLNSAAGDDNSHHAIRAQDGIVYFCDDRYVGSILEIAGQIFDPSNGSTYTFNNQALDLPRDEEAEYIEELNDDILIGGRFTNLIYPWDRVSDSFNLPIIVPERSIYKMKNIGGLVYIMAGIRGNIYITEGSYVTKLLELPYSVTNATDAVQQIIVTWGGVGVKNGNLLVGVKAEVTSANSGVYRIWPDGRFVIDNQPSTGASNATVIDGISDDYIFGYDGGLDAHSFDRYSALEGVIQSPLYRVSTKTEKGTYSVLEVVTAKPTSAGNIRIGWRPDLTASFTTLATFTADGTNSTFKKDDIGLIDLENIQVQVEIDDDFQLLEVRFIP